MDSSRNDEPTPRGGWHTPEDESSVAPETPTLPGWKVPTLPTDLSDFAETPGGWHRPRTVDTTLTPSDETIVVMPAEEAQAAIPEAEQIAPEELPAVLSPEEALQMLPEPEATADDDTPEEDAPAEPLSPEEALSMLALSAGEDEDDEEEAGVRTELLALNMLADAGDDVPLNPEDEPDDASAGELSPDDPAEVARRKLAELAAEDDDAPALVPLAPEEPALSGEEMRAQELARRFSQAQEDVEQLRTLYQNGTITPEQFEAELQNRMILDDDQIWWRMGADDAAWYKYVGDQWTPAVPPLVQSARAGLQTERLNPANDPFGGTLPYIGDSSAPMEYSGAATIPMSGGYSALPNVVPTEDLDSTIASPAAFRDSLATPTIAGATVPIGTRTGSDSLGYGSTPGIQSAIDETLPPQIDYTMPIGTIAQEAEQLSRTNTARVGVLLLVGVIALGFVAVTAALMVANNWYAGIVDRYESQINGLASYQPEFQTLVIQDANGREIARLADGGDRVEIPLSDISPYLLHAVISTRNPTFYSDPGWDTGQTIQAWLGGATAPASPTITQLVARNLVLSNAATAQEIDELVVAGELGTRYDKDFILRLFMNEFAFGNAAFGAEAAAQFYFQKSAKDLNLPEAALLASIMENPGGIDPVTNRGIIKPAIENVFARMASVGCLDLPGNPNFCITQAMFNTRDVVVNKANVELKVFRPRGLETEYPHFVNLVRQQLEAVYGNEIYRRGFIVKTTLGADAQRVAQTLLSQRLTELSGSGITTGALMWVDPASGAIRAYVGSPDYNDANIQGQRDYARDYLQPGGAIMPIVYAAAMEGIDRNGNGTVDAGEYITAGDLTWDVPAQYPATTNAAGQQVPAFSPSNIDRRFYGATLAREALANQYAAAATRVYAGLGDIVFRTMAEKMGLQFSSDAIFSLATAVGETPVRLKDLMNVYATIASGGTLRPNYAIESITDRSGVSIDPLPEILRPAATRAMSAQTAYVLQSILSDDAARNTAITPRNSPLVLNLSNQAYPQGYAGVVAATNGARTSLWTVGFTSNAVIGVWLGTPNSSVSFSNQTGLTAAAPLWNRFMSIVMSSPGNPMRAFPDPGGTSIQAICAATGMAFVQGQCSSAARNEIYPNGRLPTQPENALVVSTSVNSWTGLRANEFCPAQEDLVQRSYINTNDSFVVNWLRSAEGRATAQRLGLGTTVEALPTDFCDQTTQYPTVGLSSPTNGQVLVGDVPIMGQVNVPANLNRWMLEIAPQGSTQFQTLQGVSQQAAVPEPNSTLATWDTTAMPNGNYTIRLSVYSNNGGVIYRSVTVQINNPLPTPTPMPTIEPTAFPTLPPFNSQEQQPFTPLPFDPAESFGPTPTPNPF